MADTPSRSTTSTSPSATPHWRADFPINWEDDHYVTRRAFTAFLTLISGSLFLGTGLVAMREWWQRLWPVKLVLTRIAMVQDVPVGTARLFFYPTKHDPCLLLRVSESQFVAYSQKCTHLQCPVLYNADKKLLHCPCHEGYFSVENGAALAGPPKRALPRIQLTTKGDEIWATGVSV